MLSFSSVRHYRRRKISAAPITKPAPSGAGVLWWEEGTPLLILNLIQDLSLRSGGTTNSRTSYFMSIIFFVMIVEPERSV